jgi:hypothetical protein
VAWAEVLKACYVAKDESSAYEGGPTRRWLKVKQKGWTVEEDGWRRRFPGEDRCALPIKTSENDVVV